MKPELPDLERALGLRFPALEVAPLRQLDIGFGSVVVETRGGVIFRIARHAWAAQGHAMEAKLLPALQGRLPPRFRILAGAWSRAHPASRTARSATADCREDHFRRRYL